MSKSNASRNSSRSQSQKSALRRMRCRVPKFVHAWGSVDFPNQKSTLCGLDAAGRVWVFCPPPIFDKDNPWLEGLMGCWTLLPNVGLSKRLPPPPQLDVLEKVFRMAAAEAQKN